MKIGSDEATKLLPLLRQGAAGIDAMTEGMQKFGGEAAAELAAVRKEMRALLDESANFATRGVGGLALYMRGVGRFWKGLATGKNPMREFLSSYEERLDAAEQSRVQRLRDAADRRKALADQAAARQRAAREAAAAKAAKDKGEFPGMDDPRALYAEMADTIAAEAAEERRGRIAGRREKLEEELQQRGEMVAALRREIDAQRPAMDSLTRIGLGAGGVNYALERPRGEELLRKQIRAVEKVEEAVREIELTLEEDEFGS